MNSEPSQTDVLIVGGGVAALEAALALRARGGDLIQTTLLAPNPEFSYRPVRVGEPFGHSAARSYSLERIATDLGLRRYEDSLDWVDTEARIVHTKQGLALEYDALLLAMGARTNSSFKHAVTLDPARLDEQMRGVIQDAEGGYIHSIAFVIPSTQSWPLPIYELALMTATRAYEMNVALAITLITPEDAPLAVFGTAVSEEVRRLLDQRGITTLTSSQCVMHEPRQLTVHPANNQITVDQVIALPELSGPVLPGIPRTATGGFISTDRHGRVIGVERVFAAGDLTDFPIKHGGIAAQQADAAADAIAALAGAEIVPKPLVATLRGVLWCGDRSLHLRARVTGTHGSKSSAVTETLGKAGAKIDARYLAPYLESISPVAATVT
jgi:sulfide:quinone oxidoreductase